MNNKYLNQYLLMLAIALPIFGNAQIKTDDVPSIEVIGVAEKEVIPNVIIIRATLQEQSDKSKISIEEQEKALIHKLKQIGIPSNAITIQAANAHLDRYTKKTIDVTNRRDYLIKIATTEEVLAVFKVLDDVQIKEAKIIATSHTDMHLYRLEVKKLALQAAKNKAIALLESIGETIDKPLLIKEVDDHVINKSAISNILELRSESNAEYPKEHLEIKPITIQYSIQATFKIKP